MKRSAMLVAFSIAMLAGAARAETVYFAFVVNGGAPLVNANEFVVGVTDPATIQQIRSEIRTGKEQTPFIPEGTITKGRVWYNQAWSFHYLPDTVRIVIANEEVCDASPFLVEEEVDQIDGPGGFLPNSKWCPYSVRFTREVLVPPEPRAHIDSLSQGDQIHSVRRSP